MQGSPPPFRHFIRQLQWQTFANVATAVTGAIYVLFIGRELGATTFGVYALAVGVSTFSLSVIDLRIQEAVVRYCAVYCESIEKRSAFIKLSVLLDVATRSVSLVTIVTLSTFLASLLAKDEALAPAFIAAGCAGFAAKAANAPAVGLLRILEKVDWLAKILLLSWCTKLASAYLVILLVGPDLLLIIVAAGVGDFIFNLVTIWWAHKLARSRTIIDSQADLRELRGERLGIAKFVAGGAAISGSDSLIRELDTMIIALYLSLPMVGLYRMAKYIAQFAWRTVDAVYVVLQPVFAKMIVANQNELAVGIAAKVLLRSFLVCIVGWCLATIALPPAIHQVLGVSYEGAAPAATIMLVGVVVGAPLVWAHAFWMAAGKPHVQLAANTLAAIAAAAAYFALTSMFGLRGAAAAFAISLSLPFVLSSAIFFWSNRKYWAGRHG